MAECSKCGCEVHVYDDCEFNEDDMCWGCLDKEVQSLRQQNAELREACEASLPIVESITVQSVHYMKTHAEAAEAKLRTALGKS